MIYISKDGKLVKLLKMYKCKTDTRYKYKYIGLNFTVCTSEEYWKSEFRPLTTQEKLERL